MKVLVYPKAKNPYQDLLYNNTEIINNIEYLERPYKLTSYIFQFSRLIQYRLKGFTIFHLHWTYPFVIFKTQTKYLNFLSKFLNSFYFIFFMVFLKVINYKIVWTVHNVVPHEKEFIDDVLMMKFLSYVSDAKISLSESTISLMKKYNLSTKNISTIPIGNYINIYKNTASKDQSRKKLHIKDHYFVLLFFGIIKEYKGIEELLEAYKNIIKNDKKIYLIIAGRIYSDKLISLINKIKKEYPDNMLISYGYIDNDDVQYYFNASDIVVLPFNKLTISSSAILAMSFSKPLIYPKLGNLLELPESVGFTFEPKSIVGLTNAIKKSITNQQHLKDKGEKGFNHIKKQTWQESNFKTLQIYKSLSNN